MDKITNNRNFEKWINYVLAWDGMVTVGTECKGSLLTLLRL